VASGLPLTRKMLPFCVAHLFQIQKNFGGYFLIFQGLAWFANLSSLVLQAALHHSSRHIPV
jgi:hypothetical protein